MLQRQVFRVLIISAFCCVTPLLAWAGSADETISRTDMETTFQDFSQLSNSNKNMLLAVSGLPQAADLDWGKTIAILIFNAIGFVAFVYGKKNAAWRPMVLGIALIGYPYFISGAAAVYGVGIVLTAILYFGRD